MAWKISVSLERDHEALRIVQRMIYAAAKAQGVTDVEAHSVARSLCDAIRTADGEAIGNQPVESAAPPLQIDLEYDEETLTLLVRDRPMPLGGSGSSEVLH